MNDPVTFTVVECPCCGEPVCPRCHEDVEDMETGRCEVCGVALDDDDDVFGSFYRS